MSAPAKDSLGGMDPACGAGLGNRYDSGSDATAGSQWASGVFGACFDLRLQHKPLEFPATL
jgi:hypothetical protein